MTHELNSIKMKNRIDSVISDDRVLVYLEDAMSGTERRHFEREALLTGELRQLQHMRRSVYMAHMEYADELVGEDDFNLNNIFNMNHTISNGKYANLNHEQFLRLSEDIKSLLANKPSGMTCKAHLVTELRAKHPDLSKIEAENIIEKIQAGVDKFYIDYEAAVEKGYSNDFSIFERQMEDMSIDNKCAFLANAIIILRATNNKLGNEYIEMTFEDYHKILYGDMAPSQELLDKLTAICKEEMEDCQIPEAFMDEKTLSHVTNNERVDESVKKLLKEKETAYYLGYILYEEKKSLNSSEEVDPYIVGLGAGSSVKQAELLASSSDGDIPESKLKTFIKIAVAVAVFALVAYLIASLWLPFVSVVAPMIVSAGAGFFMNLFMGLAGIVVLGSAILCTLLWSFAAAALAYYIIEFIMEWIESRRSGDGPGSGESPGAATISPHTEQEAEVVTEKRKVKKKILG